ncbi:putative clathrin assembly protein At1g25240 [Manihot esculenta]|uniref:ENTH domain-containing protein n=1 Tax=Manihot esculenta TaxID=3983 RepID=A0A2C9UG10_MANES|nr:putative clathrin assembly protein At1g25240 [Manihot esculenta]OAY29365.1 hypothetical protein MANES_15G139100v8 [Manihot esculenta]
MKLWRRAAGALKDQRSILLAGLSRRSVYRNPDLETAIIKATNHNDSHVDYKNAQIVFAWIRSSPVTLKPLLRALSSRMEKTQSWVVALKGLMLLHDIFSCKTPAVQRIGRLPFNLSHFIDGDSKNSEMWGFNAFVRSYFAYLDQRSVHLYEQPKQNEEPLVQELLQLQNWQYLLDMLLQIKPEANNMRKTLILEAMDCVIIEVFDVYSRICNGIDKIPLGIYSAGKPEASMALKVLQKAMIQVEDLALYLQLCRNFGVFHAMEVPKVNHIPEKDIRNLERIINEVSDKAQENYYDYLHDDKAMVIREDACAIVEDKKPNGLQTIITDKWEVFDEDNFMYRIQENELFDFRTGNPSNCSSESLSPVCRQEIPDLISF